MRKQYRSTIDEMIVNGFFYEECGKVGGFWHLQIVSEYKCPEFIFDEESFYAANSFLMPDLRLLVNPSGLATLSAERDTALRTIVDDLNQQRHQTSDKSSARLHPVPIFIGG